MPFKDKDKKKEYNHNYYKKNKEKCNIQKLEYNNKNPALRLIYGTKYRAKKRGLEHNIDTSDLFLPKYCPLIGIELDYSLGTGRRMNQASIDRIDNTKGYVKGNVEVISRQANTMKNRATPEELVLFAQEILRRYANPSS